MGAMTRLEAVEMRRVRLPLVAPFRTSFGSTTERDILLLRALTADGEGWGECVALADPGYSSEYVEACQHVLREHMLPRLLGRDLPSAAAVAELLRPVIGHRMARSAIEMAVLDAELRARGESFATHLGAVRAGVECGVSVGIHDSIEALLEAVEGYVASGYRRGNRLVHGARGRGRGGGGARPSRRRRPPPAAWP